MKTILLEGLSDDEKKELRGEFKSSHYVRKRLREVIQDKINSHYTNMISRDDFNTPNWVESHAHSLGYVKALTVVQQLLDDDPEFKKRERGRPKQLNLDFDK